MRALADTVVDWTALGKVVIASLIAGVGVTVCFAFAVVGATRFADMRRDARGPEAVFYAVLGLAGLAVTAAAIVIAIIVMTKKS